MAYSQAAHTYAEEQRQELFLDLIDDLKKCDLEEVSRRTKRWHRRGVSTGTLYRWISPEAPIWPHFRTLCAVAEALGYEVWWNKTGIPKRVLKIRSVT